MFPGGKTSGFRMFPGGQTSSFSMFPGGIKVEHWFKMGNLEQRICSECCTENTQIKLA